MNSKIWLEGCWTPTSETLEIEKMIAIAKAFGYSHVVHAPRSRKPELPEDAMAPCLIVWHANPKVGLGVSYELYNNPTTHYPWNPLTNLGEAMALLHSFMGSGRFGDRYAIGWEKPESRDSSYCVCINKGDVGIVAHSLFLPQAICEACYSACTDRWGSA